MALVVHLVAEEPLCAVLVLPVLTLALAIKVERVRVRRVGAVGLKIEVYFLWPTSFVAQKLATHVKVAFAAEVCVLLAK